MDVDTGVRPAWSCWCRSPGKRDGGARARNLARIAHIPQLYVDISASQIRDGAPFKRLRVFGSGFTNSLFFLRDLQLDFRFHTVTQHG